MDANVDADEVPHTTTVSNGDELYLESWASETPGETVTVTVTIGGVTADWLITTRQVVAPTARAGPDQNAAPGEAGQLSGAASTSPYGGPERLAYALTQASGRSVVLSDPSSATASFTVAADAASRTLMEFQLTVTDQGGLSHTDRVLVWIVMPEALAPTANAGPDLSGAPGASVTLQGQGSANPYGVWWHMAHQWTQSAGPAVILDHPTRGDPSFTLPASAGHGTVFEFQLTVTGGNGLSDSDTMTVTANLPRPAATAGPDLSGAPGASVTLQGRYSFNPYGVWSEMAHQWTQLSGPPVTLDQPTHGDPSFTIPADAGDGTTFEFQLTVTDQEQQSDCDTMTVTVVVPRPTAKAGPDLSGAAGASVTLQGTKSINLYGAWCEMAHQWTQLSGPTVILDHPTRGNPSFTLPSNAADGTMLEFQLTVTDKEGVSDSDTVVVTVTGAQSENTPPTASIDAAQVTASVAGDTVALQGVGGNAETAAESLTFAWSKVGGTPTVSIASASTATAAFTAPDVTEETSLTFRLTVTDEGGLSATAETTIDISPPPEPEPTPVTSCLTNLESLTGAAEFSGAWDDSDCRAHHRDSLARYFHFTLSQETTVEINLESAASAQLFVSKDTPRNGWGKPPGGTYEDRRKIRRNNGKLVHDSPNITTLTLAAGEYTAEATGPASDGTPGTFTLNIKPQ